MPELRWYQTRALEQTRAAYKAGARAVCIVLPTGAGKSVLIAETIRSHLARGGTGVVIVVHRLELVDQMAAHLAQVLPAAQVGILTPHAYPKPAAPVQIATIQTLLARDLAPPASMLVIDEAHHIVADTWVTVVARYPQALAIGLTATPERQDGRALGDIFDHLVVGAHYSELLRDGFLVPCVAFAPSTTLEAQKAGWAQTPLAAYTKHTPGEKCFGFFTRVAEAAHWADAFTAAGYPAAVVHATLPHAARAAIFARFQDGDLCALMNVGICTEGIDIPNAAVCLLARSCGHAGLFIQIAGRILRPALGKTHATLLDLTGQVWRHGLPTDDRAYALTGTAITPRTGAPSLSTCPQCGAVYPPAPGPCPSCGYVREFVPVDITHEELIRIAHTEGLLQLRTWLSASPEIPAWYQGFSPAGQRVAAAQDRFPALPKAAIAGVVGELADRDLKQATYSYYLRIARRRGYKEGWASYKYRDVLGKMPRGMARDE